MPFEISRAAGRLRRLCRPLVTASALAVVGLAAPAGAQAADALGTGGLIVPGSALTVGVSGAPGADGATQARFSAVDSPLYWGNDTTGLNDEASAIFALRTPSGLYSAQPFTVDNQPFTPVTAPVLTGTGTVADPWVVASAFDATADLHVEQTVTHVDATTTFVGAWRVRNTGATSVNVAAFEGADMYVNGNDNGNGASSGTSPNRTIGSVAGDGTVGELIEQPSSPWTHYFSGQNLPFYDSTRNSAYGDLPDTVDLANRDSGVGVQWTFTLAAGASKTVSAAWHFTQPAAPQPPDLSGLPGSPTNQTTAAPAFVPQAGDPQVVSYQCRIDGAVFAACTSPKSYAGLADGSHTFEVRGVNSAGIAGPSTSATWTVDTELPGAPSLYLVPPPVTADTARNIGFRGEPGATFMCSLDGAAFAPCTDLFGYMALRDGRHTFSVKQIDAAGNAGTEAATTTWVIDTSFPATPAIITAPASSTATSASIAFGSVAGLHAECSLDGAGWSACTSPVVVTSLAVGEHTLRVRMVNDVGTVGGAQTVTWKVLPVTQEAKTPVTVPVPRVCRSRRSVAIHWTAPAHHRIKTVEVLVDGKVYKRLRGRKGGTTVDLRGRPRGTVKVRIVARGQRTTFAATRVYKTCVAKAADAQLATVALSTVALMPVKAPAARR